MNCISSIEGGRGSMISELHDDPLHRASVLFTICAVFRDMESGVLSFPAYVFSAWEGALVADLNLAEIRRLGDELQSVRSSGAAEIQRLSDELHSVRSSGAAEIQRLSDELHSVRSSGAAEIQRLTDELNAIRNSESVRVALHLANFVNMRLPWLLGPLKHLGSKVWAAYDRFRGRR